MKILSELENVTNLPIYSGVDVTQTPLVVVSFDELDGLLESFLSNRIAITKDNLNYRIYGANGSDFSQGKFASIGSDGLDFEGSKADNLSGVTLDTSDGAEISSSSNTNQSIIFEQSGRISVNATNSIDFELNGEHALSISQDGIDANSSTISNVADGVVRSDAATKGQLIDYSASEFQKAVDPFENALVPIDLRDITASSETGYGKEGIITNVSVNDGEVVTPDISYGLMWFIHESVGTNVGYMLIHQSLLEGFGGLTLSEIPFYAAGVRAALAKANSYAPALTGSNSAMWNCTGAAITFGNDPNSIPPDGGYYDKNRKQGGTTSRDKAFSGTFDFGSFIVLGENVLKRATVININDESVQVGTDPNSEFFVCKCTAGGSTFSSKNLFMIFFEEYENKFFDTDSYPIQLGLKVEDNHQRIIELEDLVLKSDDNEVSMNDANVMRLKNAIECANRFTGMSAYVF